MSKISRLPLSEFFVWVRTELDKTDEEARIVYASVIASKGEDRSDEQKKSDQFEAFLAAREVQLLAHERLSKMLYERFIPSEQQWAASTNPHPNARTRKSEHD